MSCKDHCRFFPNLCPNNRLRYGEGNRFCRTCYVSFVTTEIWCKCCGQRTSGKSRRHSSNNTRRF